VTASELDWNRPLTRPLKLKSGVRLVTLHDAAEAFARHFGNTNHDRTVAHAIDRMIRAAETGSQAARKAATKQVEFVLTVHRLR
jgi:hypothetical protein